MRKGKVVRQADKTSQYANSVASNNAISTSLFHSLSFRVGLGACLFVCLVLLVTYYVAETRGREVIEEQVNKLNSKIGETIALKLNERLSSTESLTTSLANLALVLPKNTDMFLNVIPDLIDNAGMKNLIAGGGIWPEPDKFTEGIARRSFFWGRDEQGILKFFDEYNDPAGQGYHNEEWYVPARYMKKGQVYWSKSYMDQYSREPMVTCMVPMWNDEGFQGVATIDLKLLGLSEFMAEQTQLIGGYALAVDRNNRLLAFPHDDERYFSTSKSGNNFPTMQALALRQPNFSHLTNILMDIDAELLKKVNVSNTETLVSLSKRLTEDSKQIDVAEASMIAAMLLGEQYLSQPERHVLVESDPILNEPVSLRVFTMLNTGWKLVVAMPIRYTDMVVTKITDSILSLLVVLLAVLAIAYAVFLRAVFISPVAKLTAQVRSLVSKEDYATKLEVSGRDELAQLASWFNVRTWQLSKSLESLHEKNLALDEARQDSEQANRTKNIYLASMSHDIRTPMNAIVGMSDILSQSELLGTEQRNYAKVINSSAQALLLLINDILDFSKIEANQLSLEHIEFNLRDMIDDCADLISFQASEKNLEFIYFLSPEINPYLLGDPGRIRQIILNLMGNALKFTDSGRIELWIEAINPADDVINLHIEVRDTGVGLSKAATENIYKPFLQADNTVTRKFGGSGLGLTISKHLSELMGGSIEFRSVENAGTTFTFSVKLKVQPQFKSGYPQKAHAKKTLLVLGQNHFQNLVIERYATAANYECKICSNLQVWLSALEVCEPSLCISLCSDLGLFGDVKRLSAVLFPNLEQHKMIVLKSQNDSELDDLSGVLPQLTILPLTLPIKFDLLNKILLEEEDVISPSNAKTAALSSLSHKKVLVVEDNLVNQQVLMIMLRHLGITAEVVSDGLEALEAAETKPFDLILMDWQMPRMDGLEATKRIRALKLEAEPVIIAVTAYAMSGDIEKCLNAGMDDYLSKPIRRDKLATTLEKWLQH